MATVVNDRDVLIMGPGQRYAAASGSALLIAASAPAFTVDVGGTPTPSSITFNAVRVNVSGTAAFSTSDGSTLTVSGDTATLAYSSMPVGSNSTTVTVSVTDGGTVYTRSTTITKVRDGASGTGTTGQRGAGTYYASGSAWSDTAAHLATPGETVVDDQVIIWNGSSFAEARRWSGSAWVASGAHLPGDLIVGGSIIGNKIKAGTLELFAADGVTPILTLGGGLRPGFEAPGTKNSDLNIGLGTGNKINNSGPYIGSPGPFARGFQNVGRTPIFGPSPAPYQVAGNGGVYLAYDDGGAPPAAGTVSDIADTVARPVVPSQRYEFSVYMSTHRCQGRIFIAWFKANGAPSDITPYTFGAIMPAAAVSGETLSYWPRAVVFGTAPSDAAKCVLSARMVSTGEATPYFFTSMWYFGAALPAQTVPSDWSDGASGTAALIDAATALTDAATAKSVADAANATLANIAADNKLTKQEKAQAIYEFQLAGVGFDELIAQADALGVSRTAYYNSKVALNQYLVPYLGAGYNDASTDSDIDGPTFRAKFADVFSERQKLIAANAAKIQANAAAAQATANAANSGLADKLSKSAASALAATITLQTNGVLLAGDTTNGVYMHSSGLVGVQGGVVKFSVPISGNPLFAGMLQAAFGSFGVVTIDANGSFSSGQTAYDTGTGWWMGFVGGVPKLSIGTASGSALLWDGSKIVMRNPDMELPTITATIDGANLAASKANTSVSVNIGSASVSLTNAKGTIRYQWSLTYLSTDPEGSTPVLTLSNDTTATVSLTGKANTNTALIYRLQCVATDANNMVSVTSIYKRCQFGTPQ